MDNTPITLKMTQDEYDNFIDNYCEIQDRLSIIGMMDLSAISDQASVGHYHLINDVSKIVDVLHNAIVSSVQDTDK